MPSIYLRRVAAALTTTTVLLSGLLCFSPSGQAATGEPMPVTAFTLNVRYSNSAAQVTADLRRVLPMGQVGGLQEFSEPTDRTALTNYLNSVGWSYYMPAGRAGSIPIVWDANRFSLIPGSASSAMVHDGVYRDRQVSTTAQVLPLRDAAGALQLDPVTNLPICAGSQWNVAMNACDPIVSTSTIRDMFSPPRFVNSVRLLDRVTGQVLGMLNNHAISLSSYDAQYGGKNTAYTNTPGVLDTFGVPYLLADIAKYADAIRAMGAQTSNVVATGDLNINYIADQRRQLDGFPTKTLGPLVNFDMPSDGSAGSSLLDYVMSLKGGTLRRTSSVMVAGLNTDHRAVVVGYNGGSQLLTNRVVPNLFRAGTLRNAPRAKQVGSRRLVLDRIVTAIRGASAGDWVRIQSRRLNNGDITGAINAARARGVRVDVKVKRRTTRSLVLVTNSYGWSNVSLTTNKPLVTGLPRMRAALVIRNDAGTFQRNVAAFNRAR